MNMDESPAIFGDGVATITVGMRGMRIYIGTHQLEYMKLVRMTGTGDAIELEIEFPASHDPVLAREIEENMRIARTIPWIKIRY